jgi:hypothetical protein
MTKSEKKIMQCLESAIQPQGIGFDPSLNFLFYFHGQGKMMKKI